MGKIVEVLNRDNGVVGYTIPDTGVRRTFAPGETKKIDVDELKQLSFIDGGEILLKEYFIVKDEEALSELNMSVEPEYFYTEAQVREILFSNTEESLAQLEDTLNYAPGGVIELIKNLAVKEEVPDTRKRKLITEKTGFNIDTAININHMLDAETPVDETSGETKTRKAAPLKTETSTPARKAAAPKYKVISENK